MQKLPQSTKPSYKKLNAYEVYLIDNKGRTIKRICGTQLSNLPKGYVCTKPAGAGTDHTGYAQCDIHDRQLSNPNNTNLWLELNKKAGLPANLLGFLENADLIQEHHLTSVDEDIKNLYGIMLYVMQKRRVGKKGKKDNEGNEEETVLSDEGLSDEGLLNNEDVEIILKITDKILKAKELRLKLNKELHLDANTVKSFVDQIFKIIVSSVAEDVAKRMLTEILENVITPFKTKGRIKGDEFEYDLEADKLYTQIEEEPKKKTKKKTRKKNKKND